jgi:hypothetical protein
MKRQRLHRLKREGGRFPSSWTPVYPCRVTTTSSDSLTIVAQEENPG